MNNIVVTLKAKEIYRGITQDQENFKFFLASAGLHISKGDTAWKMLNFQKKQDRFYRSRSCRKRIFLNTC